MLWDWVYASIADITMQLQNKNEKYGRKHILVYLGLVVRLRASLSEARHMTPIKTYPQSDGESENVKAR